MIFSNETLAEFEMEFFKVDGKYKHQRYGQALCNTFDFEKEISDLLFYETDLSYARTIVWGKALKLE